MASPTARMLLGWSLLLVPIGCNSLAANDLEPAVAPAPQADAAFEFDVREAVTYLASDELAGRGIGTEGIDKAADYIATTFRKLGLKPLGDDGTYFQTFKMTTAVAPGQATALSATLPGAAKPEAYTLKSNFVPISFSKEGPFDGEVVFVGYGVSDPHMGYDDYAGLDVKGKVVVAMRFEPHNAQGKSRFTGEDWSSQATFNRKAEAAAGRGAVALVVVNPVLHHQGDILVPFSSMFMGNKAKLPIVQVTQAVADAWLKAGGSALDLKAIQAKIDETGKPHAAKFEKPVRVNGTIEIERTQREVKNVVALLPGSDSSDAREYVVVGAHYDHVGRGGPGSLAPKSTEIHNGADDNASGTAAMLELAEHYAERGERPKRSMVFAAFTAEESGLIGSNHFVDHPPVPLGKVAAMLNLDMVGRVNDETLFVGGQGTAASFERFMKEADAASPLQLKSIGKGGFGPSDHMSFAMKKVPVLFFFSGVHRDYHRPSDDVDKINFDGIGHVVKLGVDLVDRLLAMPKEPYVDASDAQGMQRTSSGGGSRATLGVVPEYASEDVKGVKISGTVPGSPAAAAGLKDGDVITAFGADKIEDIYDLTEALQKGKPGDKVKLGLLRDGKAIEVEATLSERKG